MDGVCKSLEISCDRALCISSLHSLECCPMHHSVIVRPTSSCNGKEVVQIECIGLNSILGWHCAKPHLFTKANWLLFYIKPFLL